MQLQINFFLSILFCNQYNLVNTIIGQNVRLARSNEFRAIVSILKRIHNTIVPSRDLLCAGVLISKDNVLTAEHCLQGEAVNGIQMTVGSNSLLEGTKHYPQWWITYDQWCNQMNIPQISSWNDIAIIRLINSVSDDIPIPTVSTLAPENLYGSQVKLAGWGTTNNGSVTENLQKAILKVLTNEDCISKISELVEEQVPISNRLICTFRQPYIIMQDGDSGGPLFYEGTIVAVNSGTCPFPQEFFHPKKINIHFATLNYKIFIDFINSY